MHKDVYGCKHMWGQEPLHMACGNGDYGRRMLSHLWVRRDTARWTTDLRGYAAPMHAWTAAEIRWTALESWEEKKNKKK